MSIGLFIGSREPQKEDRFIPIASDSVFQEHWRPTCNLLKLRWVPRFQTSWMISAQDMPHVLEELACMRQHLLENPAQTDVAPHILARLNVLIRELEEIHQSAQADAIIGTPWQAQRRAAAFHRAPCQSLGRPPSAPLPKNAPPSAPAATEQEEPARDLFSGIMRSEWGL